MIDGKKNGYYREWYHNGVKKLINHYKDDVKHGAYTKYYQNGKKEEKSKKIQVEK